MESSTTWGDLFAQLEPERRSELQRQILEESERYNAFPATANQQMVWWDLRRFGDDPARNFGACLELRGLVDVDAMSASFATLVRNHEVLRTSLHLMGGRLMQLVEPMALDENVIEIVPIDPKEGWEPDRVEREWRDFRSAGFSANESRWIRVRLHHGRSCSWVMVTVNRIAFDDWSVAILASDLSAGYSAALAGREGPPPPGMQVGDVGLWQDEEFSAGFLDQEADHWGPILAGVETPPLPFGGADEPGQPSRLVSLNLSSSSQEAAAEATRRLGVTGFSWDMACWLTALTGLSGCDNLAVATYVAAYRERSELHRTIGDMGNMVLLVAPTGCSTFSDFARRIMAEVAEAVAHSYAPSQAVLSRLARRGVTGPNGGLPARTAINAMRGGDKDRDVVFEGLETRRLSFGAGGYRTPFELEWLTFGGGSSTRMAFRSPQFDDEDVGRWCRAVRTVYEMAAADPEVQVRHLRSSLIEWAGSTVNGSEVRSP